MKCNREQIPPSRRSLLGGAVAALVATVLRWRQPAKRGMSPQKPGRTPWIGHY